MPYRFALEREDYSDLAAGKVFQSLPKSPFFPIRLASEIFQRGLAIRERDGFGDRVSLYDPCCGGAYLLGTLAYLHWPQIAHLIASDIESEKLVLAERNLALLTLEGLDQRITHLQAMRMQFHKDSHAEAVDSANRLKRQLLKLQQSHKIKTTLFQADALSLSTIPQDASNLRIDMVITDLPYGRLSGWHHNPANTGVAPALQLLDALKLILQHHSIVALCTDKSQKIAHPAYQRIDHFQMGKRRITFFRPLQAGHNTVIQD